MNKPILYIGRDDMDTRRLQWALKSQGYEVVSTSGSRKAAELLRTPPLDAVGIDGEDGEQIEELHTARFPVFTQWFEDWKQRLAA